MVPGKGNIDDSVIKWTMHSAGDDWTVLKFDALLRPGVPAPQSLIDNTLRESRGAYGGVGARSASGDERSPAVHALTPTQRTRPPSRCKRPPLSARR